MEDSAISRPTVLVWDRSRERSKRVRTLAERCGAQPIQVDDARLLARALVPGSVLLAGVDDLVPPPPLVRSVMSRAARAGNPVLIYSNCAAGLSLKEKCALLAGGARHVIDSRSDGFDGDLIDRLSPFLRSMQEEAEERARVRTLMRAVGAVGESRAIRRVFRWVARVAALSDLPVLITGGTGSGKELAARALHIADPGRSRGPFLAVNCAAITASLAESEFFGHRRGAFTGAATSRLGLFRAGQGGVVFLDEIGELDALMQAKLLRVVQEKRVTAVGDDREVRIDVRVVAATNRDLKKLVQRGTFRRDLYYRLSVLPVHVPSLSERADDIAPLVSHFVRRHQEEAGRPVPEVSADLLLALGKLRMDGNVRELDNVVRQMLVSKIDTCPLDVSDLPADLLSELASNRLVDEPSEPAVRLSELLQREVAQRDWDLRACLEWFERIIIDLALAETNWNRAETARLLGITPRTVYNKIQKHQLAS